MSLRTDRHVQGERIDLVIEESWWQDFLDVRDSTIDGLEVALERGAEARRARAEAGHAELLSRLQRLADDSRFVKLPTQKAMMQYALRQIPELVQLDDKYLRSLIQELKAKIDSMV